ncbi:hypothetical protein MC885_014839 [Smutsia gigantea]|nr:hypothetical protein MC885_014839 [Smutsia gigantea]
MRGLDRQLESRRKLESAYSMRTLVGPREGPSRQRLHSWFGQLQGLDPKGLLPSPLQSQQRTGSRRCEWAVSAAPVFSPCPWNSGH